VRDGLPAQGHALCRENLLSALARRRSPFVDSNVIAGILGSMTISGVNPETLNSTAFGVAFRTAAGAAAAGTVKTNGVAAPLAAPATSGQFNYLGLAG